MPSTIESYDDIPYDSTPIRETHPANIAVQAALFGLTPPDPASCRVLELGCASGGNILPMAFYLPQAEFCGIELSRAQAEAGQGLIDTLGLKNIRIHHLDILQAEDLGQFDYILCHGVYSWAPPKVRARILALCQESLTANGIAYISYNAQPGWHMRAMVRDMLLYQVRTAKTAYERLTLAYAALDNMETAFAAQDDTVSQYLRGEIAALRGREPSYIYHEYLEDINQPFLFSTFMADAQRHGLQYLCETEMHNMFPDTLPEVAAAFIDRFDDLIEQEQAMDFLRNRTFRQTLLCRDGVAIQRELELERFAEFAFYADLIPQETPDLKRPCPQSFASPDGKRYTLTHPLTKAAASVLGERHPDALAFSELAEAAAERVQGPYREQRAHLLGELVGLYLRQVVGLSVVPQQYPHAVSVRPCASLLARVQAAVGLGHVATVRHMPMGLDDFAMQLMTYLDGTRNGDQIAAALGRDIAAGELRIEGAPRGTALAKLIHDNCARLLHQFARHGVLER